MDLYAYESKSSQMRDYEGDLVESVADSQNITLDHDITQVEVSNEALEATPPKNICDQFIPEGDSDDGLDEIIDPSQNNLPLEAVGYEEYCREVASSHVEPQVGMEASQDSKIKGIFSNSITCWR